MWYMSFGMLVNISRHLSRMSNNNKRCQLIIHCMFCCICFHRVLLWIFGFIIIIIILYLFISYLITCVLFYQSPALIILYHACSLLDVIYYLSTYSCMPVFTTWFSIHVLLIRIYGYTRAYPCTSLAVTIPLVGESAPLDNHVQIPKLVNSPSCWTE